MKWIDATGLKVLIDAIGMIRANDGKLALSNVPEKIQSNIYETEAEALLPCVKDT